VTPTVPDLTCRELVEVITEYLEEGMTAEDRRRFELHLDACEGCRTYLAQMRQVLATARELREESVAPEARDALLRAFRGWKGG
jgi:anti-sigma factor RsiW